MVKYSESFDNYTYNDKMNLFIPLHFWFTQNLGSSLQVVALQYHDIVVNVYHRTLNQCYFNQNENHTPSSTQIINSRIYCDYIFLDSKREKISLKKNTNI